MVCPDVASEYVEYLQDEVHDNETLLPATRSSAAKA